MIRHLHPTDSPRLIKFSQSAGRGETCTMLRALTGGPLGFPIVKYAGRALSLRAWQRCWVQIHRGEIQAILYAGPRSGAQSWEVSELYLKNSRPKLAANLLEQISIPASAAGASRIFARVPANSALSDEAKKVGYSFLYREHILGTGSSNSVASNIPTANQSINLRYREASDDYRLFKLHNATTPTNIKQKSGQTIEDWLAGYESLGGHTTELIFDMNNGEIGGLVQQKSIRSGHMFQIKYSNEATPELPELILAALTRSKGGRVTTSVQEFRPMLSHFLLTIGFRQLAEYEVMVKPLAQPIPEVSPTLATIG